MRRPQRGEQQSHDMQEESSRSWRGGKQRKEFGVRLKECEGPKWGPFGPVGCTLFGEERFASWVPVPQGCICVAFTVGPLGLTRSTLNLAQPGL